MARNLTLSVEEELLRAARKVALDRNTSVNQIVRDFLLQLVQETDSQQAAVARLNEIFSHKKVEVGPRTWTRDDLHERS